MSSPLQPVPGTDSPPIAGASGEEFRRVFRSHAAGVALVTADPGSGPVALTATSVFSVSAVPPMLAFSLSALSSSTPAILASDTLVVHMLGARHRDLAVLGATSGVDRFADASAWRRLSTGEPLFDGVAHWIRARVDQLIPVGASTLVIAEALEISTSDEDADPHVPLVYHDRTWHALGAASAF